jgi:hypothetical protein
MIGFSSISNFQVQLPAENDINIIIHIRDTFNSITEYNMSSIVVKSDSGVIDDLVHMLEYSTNKETSNFLIQLLATGNQNNIGQIIILLSYELNKINIQNINNTISSKYRLLFYHSDTVFISSKYIS